MMEVFLLTFVHQTMQAPRTAQTVARLTTELNSLRKRNATFNEQLRNLKWLQTMLANSRIKNPIEQLKVLEAQRLKLTGLISTLREQLRNLQGENVALISRISELEEQVQRLKKELVNLNELNARLAAKAKEMEAEQQRLETANTDLKQQIGDLNAQLDDAKEKQGDLTDQIAALKKTNDALRKRNQELLRFQIEAKKLNESNKQLQGDLAKARKELADAWREIERLRGLLGERGNISKELVGLKGGLGRVAFVFDHSASMNDDPQRWKSALRIVETWLQHLGVRECVVIAFNDKVTVFPEGGRVLTLLDKDGNATRYAPQERQQAIDWLREKTPYGMTNTLDALKAAYQYEDIEMILLFTDGAPKTIHYPDEAKLREDIVAECKKHVLGDKQTVIPVNAIGLGEYYKDREFANFLLRITRETGGTFLGR